MTRARGSRQAFGWPGIEPRWTRSDKDGVGTAYSADSRVWFTVRSGVVTEVYYPTVDRPQVRDLQLLVTDGESFFHEERRHLTSVTQELSHHVLGYHMRNTDPAGRYVVTKEVIAAPHLPCVLQHIRLTGVRLMLPKLRVFVLCAPHLEVGGRHNNASVVEAAGRWILTAEKGGTWLALGASVPFVRLSCGYVGQSDGWTDLAGDLHLDWEFDAATDGNVALTAEVDRNAGDEFTLGLAFGDSLHSAINALLQSLATPFRQQRRRYVEQWHRACRGLRRLEPLSGDGGDLYHTSYSLLLAHEDKTYPGALIASLSIPWGEAHGDEDLGGYHLVWTRDMVNSATGLLAAGDTETPLRALIYLATNQQPDGGFPQNFWISGDPYWTGIQLDEVAFPVLLAWKLHRAGGLGHFDPYPMVMRAASYLVRHGPATQQERWEENGGYSPSTLAASIAALICAASFARERDDAATAQFLEEYADFLECHLEPWTVTTAGTLLPGVTRHYIRLLPVEVTEPQPLEDPNQAVLLLRNQAPGDPAEFPAREIVDAGFLELVRYGIRRADDPIIVDSLRVVDAVLKVDTPAGPCWRRYNHDGYGQRQDAGPYLGWGTGRAWPLLTGERGHYELAAGRDVSPLVRALEGLATATGLLPEQVWDAEDLPAARMHLGKPTGSAMPLMWAHAEYIKLLRSASDGQVFDLIPEVARRYQEDRGACKALEIWKPNRQPREVAQGWTLRVQAPAPFLLHWSLDNWQSAEDTVAAPTSLGVHFVDILVPADQEQSVRFTFYWTAEERWEGRDYAMGVGVRG